MALSALCCSTALADQPAREHRDPLAVGSAPAPTSSASELSRSASASSAASRLRRPAQPGSPLAACQAAMTASSREKDAGPGDRRVVAGVGEVAIQRPQAADEPLGMGGHRLGHVAPGGETAPMMVTEPSRPSLVTTRPARS